MLGFTSGDSLRRLIGHRRHARTVSTEQMRELGLSKALDEYHKLLDRSDSAQGILSSQKNCSNSNNSKECGAANDVGDGKDDPGSSNQHFWQWMIIAILAPPVPRFLRPEIIFNTLIIVWHLLASILYFLTFALIPISVWCLGHFLRRNMSEELSSSFSSPSPSIDDANGTVFNTSESKSKTSCAPDDADDYAICESAVDLDNSYQCRFFNVLLSYVAIIPVAIVILVHCAERTVAARRVRTFFLKTRTMSHESMERRYKQLSTVCTSDKKRTGGLSSLLAKHSRAQETIFVDGVCKLMKEYGNSQHGPTEVRTAHEALEWLLGVSKEIHMTLRTTKYDINESNMDKALQDLENVRKALLA